MKTITIKLSHQLEYSRQLKQLYSVTLETVDLAVECIRFLISLGLLRDYNWRHQIVFGFFNWQECIQAFIFKCTDLCLLIKTFILQNAVLDGLGNNTSPDRDVQLRRLRQKNSSQLHRFIYRWLRRRYQR